MLFKAGEADHSEAGFVTNDKKSVWELCQRLVFVVLVGITWDSARRNIEIVHRRIAKIARRIDSIIDSDFVISTRRLASFSRQIISTAPVSRSISTIFLMKFSDAYAESTYIDSTKNRIKKIKGQKGEDEEEAT